MESMLNDAASGEVIAMGFVTSKGTLQYVEDSSVAEAPLTNPAEAPVGDAFVIGKRTADGSVRVSYCAPLPLEGPSRGFPKDAFSVLSKERKEAALAAFASRGLPYGAVVLGPPSLSEWQLGTGPTGRSVLHVMRSGRRVAELSLAGYDPLAEGAFAVDLSTASVSAEGVLIAQAAQVEIATGGPKADPRISEMAEAMVG